MRLFDVHQRQKTLELPYPLDTFDVFCTLFISQANN
jgi:hypothetical protein